MATKKDFTGNINKLHSSIANATADAVTEPRKDRKTYTADQAAEFLAAGATTGHKGVKLPRINMAFTPDVYDYIKTMSRVTGQTITEFVNTILRNYMEDHTELYDQAKAFRNNL